MNKNHLIMSDKEREETEKDGCIDDYLQGGNCSNYINSLNYHLSEIKIITEVKKNCENCGSDKMLKDILLLNYCWVTLCGDCINLESHEILDNLEPKE